MDALQTRSRARRRKPTEQAYIDASGTALQREREGARRSPRPMRAMAKVVAPSRRLKPQAVAESRGLMPWVLPDDGERRPYKNVLAQIERVIAKKPEHPGSLQITSRGRSAATTERAKTRPTNSVTLVPVAGHCHMRGISCASVVHDASPPTKRLRRPTRTTSRRARQGF